MIFSKKKLVLRCLGTFIFSCLNPIMGLIVGVICFKETIDEIQTDRAIVKVISMHPEEYWQSLLNRKFD